MIEVFDFNGKALGTLNQPAIGSASIAASEDRTEAYLSFASFNYPPTIFRVDLATPGAAPKYWSGPDVPVDPAIDGSDAGLVSVKGRHEDQDVLDP